MAATKYSHPFLNGLKPTPKGYDDEIQEIKECVVTLDEQLGMSCLVMPLPITNLWDLGSADSDRLFHHRRVARALSVKQQPRIMSVIYPLRDIEDSKYPMKSQPHLPYISDEYVLLFLHSNYFKVKETKDTIECYFTLRGNTPDLFSNRDPLLPRNKTVLDITHMVALPKLTEEGYHVLLYRLADLDYSKLNFADAVRVFCMFNDVKLSEDRLSEGYIVIFDMRGCSLGHLTRVTLPALRAFMHYIQNAHPCRLKKIHVVHTVFFINQVMCLVKPLIHSNLLNLLNFTSDGPDSVVDKELLPEDYGGSAPPVKQLHEEQRQNMENNYIDWLKESEIFKVDEKKRIKKPNRGMFASFTSSFKSLDID